MPPSTRRRTLMRIWFGLMALMFLVRCAAGPRPAWLKGVWGGTSQASGVTMEPAHAPRELSAQPEHAPPEAVRSRDGIRIATWNLEWLDVPGRGREGRKTADYAVLARYARTLDADVIAVQEVASEDALRLVFPPDEYAYHLAEPATSQHSGFAYRRTLAVTVHPDVTALALDTLRAGADIGVRVGATELRLLSVHLKAMCVKAPLTKRSDDCEKLARQVPVLEAWVDDRTRQGVPFGVLGDFNRVLADPRDALWLELDDGEPTGLVLERASMRTHVSCDGTHREAAIDHVVLGGRAAGWLDPASFYELRYEPGDVARAKLSDHCPIRVDLRVPSAG